MNYSLKFYDSIQMKYLSKISACHTYRYKRKVCYPFLDVPNNFISFSPQKHSRACAHPATKFLQIKINRKIKWAMQARDTPFLQK